MRVLKIILSMVVVLGMSPLLCGADFKVPKVQLPLMKHAPTIDGVIRPSEWAGAARMERFGRDGSLSPQKASFWIGSDGKNLYIAVLSETPPGGKILERANPMPGDIDAKAAFADDSIELVIAPFHSINHNKQKIYHAFFNAKKAVWDQARLSSGHVVSWRGDWNIGSKVIGNHWNFELAIPLKSLGITGSILDKKIGVRIGRNWRQSVGSVQTEWSPLGGSYLNISTMPIVTWDAKAPVVQVLQIQDSKTNDFHVALSVRNPHRSPMILRVQLHNNPQNSASRNLNKLVFLKPEQTKIVQIQGGILPNERIISRVLVTSVDGKEVFYRRGFGWSLNRPKILWTLGKNANKKIALKFAYYPYHHAVKVRVDMRQLDDPKQVKAVKLTLRTKKSKHTIAQIIMPPAQNGVTQLNRWNLPTLKGGKYELVADFKGTKFDPQIYNFVRYHFKWEHNTLGKANVVVPPFEPLKVKKHTVSMVLRKITMNGLGLWEQVVAKNKPLLNDAMQINIKSEGKTYHAVGNLKFKVKKGTQVVSQAQWSGGPLNGTTQSVWDYDGMMKTTLTLKPTDKPVKVTLIIPVANNMAPLMAACTDGIRFNYAGFVPKGEGSVWNGSKAPKRSIIGSYVPYIWVGGAQRGISVFGSNDRGWITSPNVPCQELIRRADGALEVHLNLISTPTCIKHERQIVLGFLATPVKPMPKYWRRWTINLRASNRYPYGMSIRNAPHTFEQNWLGSCYYWGALTAFRDIYPRGKDFSLWHEYARARKTHKVDYAFIKKWLDGYKIHGGSQANYDKYKRHIRAGFQVVAGQADGIMVYTNSRGVRFDTPEGQTFLSPWERHAFAKRIWGYGGGVGYDLNPVESYRDYAAWYWKKMFSTFVGALYWDNIFMQSSFDTIGTPAYKRKDGNIQPASGLFNTRALVRRGMVLAYMMGNKVNRNMVHMTNTPIAPILGFAGSQLSWEGRRHGPYQERRSRAYIRAESIGRQFGTVPFIVGGQFRGTNDPDKIAWFKRTGTGVLLTHEIKITYQNWKVWRVNYDRLIKFGYGLPKVKIFNYWQDNYPIKIIGIPSSSIVLSKPGEAMIVVCDWSKNSKKGEVHEVRVKLNKEALGLIGNLSATDSETGKSLNITSDGTIIFSLKRYDFKMIHVAVQ